MPFSTNFNANAIELKCSFGWDLIVWEFKQNFINKLLVTSIRDKLWEKLKRNSSLICLFLYEESVSFLNPTQFLTDDIIKV